VDIGTTLDELTASNTPLHAIVDVIDVAQKDPMLKGFSGIFNCELCVGSSDFINLLICFPNVS
jgi:hypothetical protein